MKTKNKAFTLIELLVVVAIIGLLVGLLLNALGKAKEGAKKQAAQANIYNLGVAMKAFFAEYGYYPIPQGVTSETAMTDAQQAKLYLLLSGNKTEAAQAGSTVINPGNPRGLVFFDAKSSSISTAGCLLDPWKNTYQIAMDTGLDGSITIFGSTKTSPFAIWSKGSDGLADIGAADTDGKNRDNPRSWK